MNEGNPRRFRTTRLRNSSSGETANSTASRACRFVCDLWTVVLITEQRLSGSAVVRCRNLNLSDTAFENRSRAPSGPPLGFESECSPFLLVRLEEGHEADPTTAILGEFRDGNGPPNSGYHKGGARGSSPDQRRHQQGQRECRRLMEGRSTRRPLLDFRCV